MYAEYSRQGFSSKIKNHRVWQAELAGLSLICTISLHVEMNVQDSRQKPLWSWALKMIYASTQQVQVVPSFVRYCKKNIPPKPIVLPVWYGYFWGPTQIKHHVSRAILKIWHFYWGENRVKISLLFLTSETLDFESEYIFESHEHSQSTTDIMPVLTSF